MDALTIIYKEFNNDKEKEDEKAYKFYLFFN